MKAIIYARYSSDLQRQASIADQSRNCERLIEREGWEIVARYKDEAMSGAKADRPGYLALMNAAKAREFDVIVVDEVSRLWRDQEEQWRAVKRLEFYGVHIRSVNDGVNTLSEGFGLLLSLRGAINEEARREIGKRTHRGLTGQAIAGYNAGGRSYGYRHVPIEDPSRKDHLGRPIVVAVRREVDPEQAAVVRRIFEWYADGLSPRKIADRLNVEGIPPPGASWNRSTRHCRGWAGSAIYGDKKRGFGILLNPLYGGMYVWNRTRRQVDPDTKARKHAARPETDWVVKDAPELRIVPPDLWERVQKRMSTRRGQKPSRNGPGKGRKYLLSGLLKCGVCGGNFIILNAHSYGCATHKDRGPHACGNHLKVNRLLVETLLLESVKRDLFTDEYIQLFKRETSRLLAARHRDRNPHAAQQRLTTVRKEIDNLLAAIKAGIRTPTTKSELERLEAEHDKLLAALKPETRKLDKVGHMLPRAVERFKEMVGDLESATLHDVVRARTQLRHLIGEVPLRPGKDGFLVAELSGNYAGLLKMAGVEIEPHFCGTEERT